MVSKYLENMGWPNKPQSSVSAHTDYVTSQFGGFGVVRQHL